MVSFISKFSAPKLPEVALKPSYELARAQYMGWTFGKPVVRAREFGGYSLELDFTCVCGRKERFINCAMDPEALRYIDPILYLTENGNFGRPHLLEDGYTEEQVREIERKGEEFDRITREHWEGDIISNQSFDRYRLFRMRQADPQGERAW